jgi:hypothetical protein
MKHGDDAKFLGYVRRIQSKRIDAQLIISFKHKMK